VIGVRFPIEQDRTGHRSDGLDYFIDDFGTPALAEIRNALNNATHAENPTRSH
jgi:hypothetical protein